MMLTINTLKKLLQKALSSSDIFEKQKYTDQFRNLVYDDTSIQDEKLDELIMEIAYDLEFYVPNEEWRKEDTIYYGPDKLKSVLTLAIQKLEKYELEQHTE